MDIWTREWGDEDMAEVLWEMGQEMDNFINGATMEEALMLLFLPSPSDTQNADSAGSPRQGLVEGKESEDG